MSIVKLPNSDIAVLIWNVLSDIRVAQIIIDLIPLESTKCYLYIFTKHFQTFHCYVDEVYRICNGFMNRTQIPY